MRIVGRFLVSLVFMVAANGLLVRRAAAEDAPLQPKSGFYFGASLQWDKQTPARFNRDLGMQAAVFGLNTPIPLRPDDEAHLTRNLTEISAQGAMAVANIPIFQRENVMVNTAGHTAALLCCWLMVKWRVLFRVIPR